MSGNAVLSSLGADLAAARAAWSAEVQATGLSSAKTDSGVPVEPVYTPLDVGIEDPDYLARRGLPGS